MNDSDLENKNVNNKVDILYNFWLGIRFVERELYNDSLDKSKITKIRDLFKE